MKRNFTFLMVAFALMVGMMMPLGMKGENRGVTTYTFTSKKWEATPANWTSGKDGYQMSSGRGVQVTKTYSGANATSPTSLSNITKVEVTYSTNASSGAGTIKIQVGSNSEKSFTVTSSGGATDRKATFNYATPETGKVKLTVTCTTNSVYIKSVAITTGVNAPTFSPAAGTYVGNQNVTISTSTSGATIYYTTDGSTPTTSSNVYSSAIPVTTQTTIKAIAVSNGMSSDVASATYTIAAAQPSFSPAAGMFTPGSAPDVTINCATSGATIHYTTDGSTPTTSSPVYSSPIPVRQTTTIKAIAVKSGLANSDVASAEYVISSTLTATYTVSTTSSVTTSGTVPSGSSASFSQTYNTPCQMTSGNSMTLTLSGYQGKKITGLVLSMKSNSQGGRGCMYMKAGSTTLASIGSSSNDVSFKDDDWYGSWSTTYVNITPTMSNNNYCIQQGETVVIYIHATANSLYCRSFTLYYEDDTEPKINANDPQTLAYDATSGAFGYSITNPVAGTSLQAVSNSAWITNPQVGASQVTFTTTANDTGIERTGTITLTYGTVTKTITVTQAAIAPVLHTTHTPTTPFPYTGGSDTFNFSVTNPVTGATVTAVADNWITPTVSDGTVNFQVAENHGGERSGNITLNYMSYGNTLATTTVSISQEANPDQPGSEANPYTVAQAVAATPSSGSSEWVYVRGIVSYIEEIEVVQYHNATYNISDDGGTTSVQLQVFYGRNIGDTDFLSEDELLLGDEVVVYGQLKMYHSTPELDRNNYIVSLNRAVQPVTFSPSSCVMSSENDGVMLFTESFNEGWDVQIFYSFGANSNPITNGIQIDDIWDIIPITQSTTIKAAAYIPELNKWSVVTEAIYTIVSPESHGWEGNPYTVSEALVAIDQAPDNLIQGVYVQGIVSGISQIETTQYYNATYFISNDGQPSNQLYVYRGKYINGADFVSEAQLQVGDQVTVFGDLYIYGETKEFKPKNYLTRWYRPTSIVVAPSQYEFNCNATSGSIDVFYSDDIQVNVNNPTLQFCDADGNEVPSTTYEWLQVSLSQTNDWDLMYDIEANSSDQPRTAYLKVLCQDQNGNNIESNLITITQNEYRPDFAELPFEFNGVRDDIEGIDGLTQNNLGEDYAASTSPTTRLKFESKTVNGVVNVSSLVLKINEAPGILSYNIKANSSSGAWSGTFKVQASADGLSWNDMYEYNGSNLNATVRQDTINNLPSTTRYIRWIYVTKSNGNVGLGNIKLTKAPCAIEIVQPTIDGTQVGTIYTNAQEAVEGVTVGMSINYQPNDYYFVEWVVTDVDGNPVTVDNPTAITAYFTMPASSVTITATLVIPNTPCTYAYSVNGVVGEPTTASVGEQIQLMSSSGDIAFNGQTFTFRGWTTDANDVTNLLLPSTSFTLRQDVTFYAVYQQQVPGLVAEKHYAKVTRELSDWSGDYLIVYETGNVAFNGALETLDAANNTVAVTISNGIINATETMNAAKFTIAAIDGGYSIKSASGKYIGRDASSNGLNAHATTVYVNTISYTPSGMIEIQGAGGAYLKYNTSSGNTRFRYYMSGQKDIQLYKYVGSVSNLYTRIFMSETASSVIIEGPSLIPEGSVLNATTLSNTLGADRLVVAEGAQLVTSSNVDATIMKAITAYQSTTDNYYLISTPVDGQDPTEANMTDGAFDLYSFDQTQQGKEWQNYEANAFALQSGKGYLYANEYGGNIVMAGQMNGAANGVTISQASGKPFAGWNLIGNPYPCNVTINKPFYRLAEGGAALATEATDNSVAIGPMEGVFVCADRTETVSFTKAPTTSTTGGRNLLSMRVSRNRNSKDDRVDTDNAIVRFGEGDMLRKLVLNPDLSQLYVAQDGTDYAIVNAEAEGEMPVSFRAAVNGSYTFSVAAEGVTMRYLHLIDHKTGTDVDLLQTPSYTFEASTADYECRFTLVFARGASTTDDTFAYYNGSQWVVNSDGATTLQVIDMMGRVLSSQTVNGNAQVSIDRAAGVYLLRLMKGDDVKVQKIIIQ